MSAIYQGIKQGVGGVAHFIGGSLGDLLHNTGDMFDTFGNAAQTIFGVEPDHGSAKGPIIIQVPVPTPETSDTGKVEPTNPPQESPWAH